MIPRERYRSKTPDPEAMLEGLRSIGYDFSTAVADIIDNCVPAGADRVDIFYDGNSSDPYFEICDNGCGMSESELDQAMDFGTRKNRDFGNKKDLGRFGLGLKTASLSQCRKFVVVTKRWGIVLASSWDVDYVMSTGSWSVVNLTDEEIKCLPHVDYLDDKESGTIVIWQKFDKIEASTRNFADVFNKLCVDAEKYCSLVFHRFYDRMHIFFNMHRVRKMDPFLEGFGNVTVCPKVAIPFNGSTIYAQAYRMPAASDMSNEQKDLIGGLDALRRDQGFFIYRNDRLIVWGKWLRLEHRSVYTRLARIKVDVPATLDKEWSLDVKKSTASIPEDIKRKLWAPINDSLNQSAMRVKYEGEKEVSGEYERIWIRRLLPNNRVTYSLNEDYPLFSNFVDTLDQDQKKAFFTYIRDVENYVPTSKMRDDISEDLKVVNGSQDENKESLRKELVNTIFAIANGNLEALEPLLTQLLGWEKWGSLKEEKDSILRECLNGKKL